LTFNGSEPSRASERVPGRGLESTDHLVELRGIDTGIAAVLLDALLQIGFTEGTWFMDWLAWTSTKQRWSADTWRPADLIFITLGWSRSPSRRRWRSV
jgi:hypothetical protein